MPTTEKLRPFVHPETGEILETEADFRRALDAIEQEMIPFWSLRRIIQEAFADRTESELPARLSRTEKQERVAHCPRCRRVISEEDAYDVALAERLRRQGERGIL